MHIYIYIYAVKLLCGPSLGFQGLLSGPNRGYYLVQICFCLFYSGFKRFFCTLSYHFVFFGVHLSGAFLKITFFEKKRVQKLGFSIFSVLSLNFESFVLAETQ